MDIAVLNLVFTVFLGVVSVAGGWVLKLITDNIKEAKLEIKTVKTEQTQFYDKLYRLNAHIPSKYISREEVDNKLGLIHEELKLVNSKIDEKVGKK